ncbi:hypothetical protein [Serratia marcescens]|uniref:hypothetical protein n=1 Tax=Serratia marcescens TaxID=615 RepID=UPI0006684371|nr:hypothetical protein [Serratia marcescens]
MTQTLGMVNVKEREGVFLSILRWAIAFFFIATPFNPYINSMTIYLWIPLVFLDIKFISKLKFVNLKICVFLLSWISLCILFGRVDLAVKSFVLILGVAYIVKLGDVILDKIYACMLISAGWCILQFVLYQFGQSYSAMIGPKAISILIWGEYATKTFTNQYEVFFLARMSGLSREAGFFVSLLLISFMIRIRDHKLNKYEYLIFGLSYLFSLSKASFFFVIFCILYPIKKFMAKVPVIFSIILFIVLCIVVAQYLNVGAPSYFYENESIAHRFSAPYLMLDMTVPNFIYGCDVDYTCFNSYQPIIDFLNGYGFKPNVGLAGIVLDLGIVGLIAIVFFLIFLGLDSYDAAILVCFTSTVTFFTVDSFIILTYYYVISNRDRLLFMKNE